MAVERDGRAPAAYLVAGLRRNGKVTYRCPNAAWALRKLRDFQHAGYAEITVTAPDGAGLDEHALAVLVEGHGILETAEG